MEKEKEALLLQIGKLSQQNEENQQKIHNQLGEENKLRRAIEEADVENGRLKKENETIVQERVVIY